MVQDKINHYFEALENPPNLAGFQMWGILIMALLMVVGLILITTALYNDDFNSYIKTKVLKQGSKKGKEKVRYNKTSLGQGVLTFILGTMVTLSGVTFGFLWSQSVDEHSTTLEELKKEIITDVFSDYLHKYDGKILKPTGTISISPMHDGNLYKTSFYLEDVYYTDQLVYVTYTDSIESNTLVPFDVEDSLTKKRFYLNYIDVEKETEKQTYFHEVDFIYNIKIND